MKNFDSLINEMLHDGATLEQIQKELNKAQHRIKRVEAESADARNNLLTHYKKLLDEHYKAQTFMTNDGAMLAAVAYAKQHPEWTDTDIQTFRKKVLDSMKDIATHLKDKPSEKKEETEEDNNLVNLAEAICQLFEDLF